MARLSRRNLLRAGVGAGAVAALAGCGTGARPAGQPPLIPRAGPGETVHLTYWSWLKDLQRVCDVWNAAHPRVQVEAVWSQPGNDGGYQSMFSALAAGGGPDIAQIEMRQIPAFMLVNGLVDLSRYGFDRHADKYDPTLVSQVGFNGGVYGAPQDSGPCAFFHRSDLLDEIGAEPPGTWQEWTDLSAEYRAADRYLECFYVSDTSLFAAIAAQAGAAWFQIDGDRWAVDLTDDATMMVAEHFDRAIERDLVETSLGMFSPGWFAAAADGRIGAITCASWADALIQGTGGTEGLWRVAPMPTWSGTGYGSTQLGGSTAAVLANSAHPQEALDFSVWMTTDPAGIDAMIEHSGIGWTPAPDHIGTRRRQASEFFGGQRYNEEVFVPASRRQNPDWIWSPVVQQVFDNLADNFRRRLTGEITLMEACARTERDTVRMLRDKGLSARSL
ncbi:carbohydrate ABC transporter substrate-binding protein (CUT1 family) [Murinocardiopsis flavida]|uniref:Carbohydrate ABC transporter substrate-binding protein (CUT1 family) n=1 Tax=Murinocardiopsis flavida TaxID=645275 RepID=A0A2P8CJ94_9ACTN|nr:extracellular solute-binding protein [Murinocardiopsis flavida]PSK85038.1 carbohydrate ABC transporter substrate-binding protein (CUT1 family) [Murinocardiopsis flavida]